MKSISNANNRDRNGIQTMQRRIELRTSLGYMANSREKNSLIESTVAYKTEISLQGCNKRPLRSPLSTNQDGIKQGPSISPKIAMHCSFCRAARQAFKGKVQETQFRATWSMIR